MADVTKRNLRIYCCGGGGINIGKKLASFRNAEPGFPNTSLAFVDTSKSNLVGFDGVPDVYFIRDVINDEDLDGGAKVRRENVDAITRCVPEILQKFQPGDFNIVISTGSGGSGGVIAGTIVSQLLKDDHPTIAVMIGSIDTKLEAENTLKSLQSYENIARSVVKKPVALIYLENSPEHPRKLVNEQAVSIISDLKVLFSGENIELDTRDLYNWLNFDRCTSNEPRLAMLDIIDSSSIDDDLLKSIGNVMSVAILSSEEEDCQLPFFTEYRCTGFIPEPLRDKLSDRKDIMFVLNDGIVQLVNKHLQTVVKDMDAKQSSRIRTESIVSKTNEANESGLLI